MRIQDYISLKELNTFRMDVKARFFSEFKSEDELHELLDYASAGKGIGKLILGGGSNLLFTRDFDGIVMKNCLKGIDKVAEDDAFVYVKAAAGENWHLFVLYCLDQKLNGVENLALIPGSVGATPMQNIGAYGVEIKDVFHSLEAIHMIDGTKVDFNADDCGFGYRESVFKNRLKNQFVITSVTYRLSKKPNLNTGYGAISRELERMKVSSIDASAIAHAVINIRKSKLPDPAITGNAGSFFKNPEVDNDKILQLQQQFPDIVSYPLPNGHAKLAAGWLIEKCGWKGYRNGDAGCHEAQALVLINYGHAKGDEIVALGKKIKEDVQQTFGVELQEEVNII